jgi:hypothetical protein
LTHDLNWGRKSPRKHGGFWHGKNL